MYELIRVCYEILIMINVIYVFEIKKNLFIYF